MYEVVRRERQLAFEVWVFSIWECGSLAMEEVFYYFETWDDVVDGDVPEKVEQAAYQPNHQDPNWRKKNI